MTLLLSFFDMESREREREKARGQAWLVRTMNLASVCWGPGKKSVCWGTVISFQSDLVKKNLDSPNCPAAGTASSTPFPWDPNGSAPWRLFSMPPVVLIPMVFIQSFGQPMRCRSGSWQLGSWETLGIVLTTSGNSGEG